MYDDEQGQRIIDQTVAALRSYEASPDEAREFLALITPRVRETLTRDELVSCIYGYLYAYDGVDLREVIDLAVDRLIGLHPVGAANVADYLAALVARACHIDPVEDASPAVVEVEEMLTSRFMYWAIPLLSNLRFHIIDSAARAVDRLACHADFVRRYLQKSSRVFDLFNELREMAMSKRPGCSEMAREVMQQSLIASSEACARRSECPRLASDVLTILSLVFLFHKGASLPRDRSDMIRAFFCTPSRVEVSNDSNNVAPCTLCKARTVDSITRVTSVTLRPQKFQKLMDRLNLCPLVCASPEMGRPDVPRCSMTIYDRPGEAGILVCEGAEGHPCHADHLETWLRDQAVCPACWMSQAYTSTQTAGVNAWIPYFNAERVEKIKDDAQFYGWLCWRLEAVIYAFGA